ncbi:uncharacterized protein pdgfbb [Aplochiton taeniatus]
MSSWVQLLALLAAFLWCGAAEGDPLPAALVELVRSTPISSIEDLQLLLLSDSVDDDQDGSPGDGAPSNTSNRLPRSLDAQPARQALCKTRTEVVEVTRAMLDRSNANFLLWPPCVEVQRCSGCCNTKTLQCVPVLTHTRYLQVMKIEYVNKRPSYAKAVVSVLDHVECQCQSVPRAPPPPKKKTPSRRQQHQAQGGEGAKLWPKEELHRRDELKDTQRVQLEELLEQHPWGPRGDTFTQAGGDGSPEGYSLAGEDAAASPPGERGSPHWVRNATRLLGTAERLEPRRDGRPEERRGGRRGGFNDSETVLLNRTAVVGFDLWSPGNTAASAYQTPGSRLRPTEPTNQRRENRFRPTEVTNQGTVKQKGRQVDGEEKRRDNKTPDEEEGEEEEAPTAPAVPRTPVRPNPPRKRMRKNRKRISKAAMRAMLM